MKTLVFIFFISLALGQLGAVQVYPGLTFYLHDLLVCLILLVWVAAILKKNILRKAILGWSITAYVLVGAFSLLVNHGRLGLMDLGLSSLYLWRFLTYAGLYLVVSSGVLTKRVWLGGLYLTGLFIALGGLVQYLLYPDLRNLYYLGWDPHYLRVFSTLLDPNFTGLVISLSLILGFWFMEVGKINWLWLGIQSVNLMALTLTYSRSSYLAILAGMTMLIIITRRYKLFFGLIITLLVLVLFNFIMKPGGGLRLDRLESSVARIGNWERGVLLIKESPLIGWGFNTLRYVQRDKGWTQVISKSAGGLDNSFLFIAATTGFMGLFTFSAIVYGLVKLAQKNKSKEKDVSLGAILLASILAIFVHSFFNNSLFYPWVMIWIWILAGSLEQKT